MPYFYLTVVICLFDQLVKLLVQAKMAPFQSLNVIANFLSFTYVSNYGAAFGILESKTLFLVIVALGVFLYTWINRHQLSQYPKIFQIGLAIAIGGALGNFIDRVRLGYVVDFIDLHIWPVFNIADIAIVLGVGLMVLGLLSERSVKNELGSVNETLDCKVSEEEQG